MNVDPRVFEILHGAHGWSETSRSRMYNLRDNAEVQVISAMLNAIDTLVNAVNALAQSIQQNGGGSPGSPRR